MRGHLTLGRIFLGYPSNARQNWTDYFLPWISEMNIRFLVNK